MSKSKYQTMTGEYGYSYGIYERGRATLQRGPNRWRAVWDCVRWHGNTGGATEERRYLTPAEGRALLRRIRQNRLNEAHGQWDGNTIVGLISGQC